MTRPYRELSNDVLATNYHGEILTVELISRLLARPGWTKYHGFLSRQLLDETRHANLTREFALARGCDPARTDARGVFAFHRAFSEFTRRGDEATLAFLGENERVSAKNFSLLIRIAELEGDHDLAGLYGEILGDEVAHSRILLSALPDDPDVAALRADARDAMRGCVSLSYLRLRASYPEVGSRRRALTPR